MTSTPPPGTDRFPQLDRPGFYCPHPRCGVLAQQDWVELVYPVPEQNDYEYLQSYVTGEGYGDPFDSPGVRRSRWRAARCGTCQEWSIWLDEQMVYPRARLGAPAHPDMPEAVRELYAEGAAVAVVSRRAGAALARATVERLLKHLDPTAPTRAKLEERIGRVRGRVSTPLAQLLDVVRVTGNCAVHVDDQPGDLVVMALDDAEGPELLLGAVNGLVDELITRPKITDELWEKLPAGVKAKLAPATSPADTDE